MDKETPAFQIAANAVADELDADVLLINASIYYPLATSVIDLCRNQRRRKNVVLVLVTNGGDAHAAYRVARCLQRSYERTFLFLTGSCKSAGTLVAVGAHELIVAETGELGPLDVQMSKPDELFERQSGLTATAALSTLHRQAFEAFEHFFLSLVRKSGSTITTRTATHIAVQLTSGLFAPMYEHLDPMHVGEAGRALQVAEQYGAILRVASGNISAAGLSQLTSGFASHDFVIDLAQIRTLFEHAREPTEHEQRLADLLGSFALVEAAQPTVAYLSTQVAETAKAHDNEEAVDDQPASSRATEDNATAVASGTASGGQSQATESGNITTIRQVNPRPRRGGEAS